MCIFFFRSSKSKIDKQGDETQQPKPTDAPLPELSQLPKAVTEPPPPPVTPTVKKPPAKWLFTKKQQPSTPEQHPSQQPSPFATPSSSISGSPAPSLENVPKRGRSHKDIQLPSYNVFPVGGTAKEQKYWLKLKNTQYWHYTKLTGQEGEKYCKRESARVSKACSKKKCLDVEVESPEVDLSIIDDNGQDLAETKEDN